MLAGDAFNVPATVLEVASQTVAKSGFEVEVIEAHVAAVES
jgi:hypothetical protein